MKTKPYKCTDCHEITLLEDNVGFCSRCGHPLWNPSEEPKEKINWNIVGYNQIKMKFTIPLLIESLISLVYTPEKTKEQTPMNKPEYILCTAIWVNDNQFHEQQPLNIEIGFVVTGRRHHNCYQTIKDLKGDVNAYFKSLNISEDDYRQHQGFITSEDRYVNRKEGWVIAKNNNQIQFGLEASEDGDNLILISENLY